MLARQSTREACQTLFYVQAVDQAKAIVPETNTAQFYEDSLRIPSIQKTKRLPSVVLFHYGVRVRLTTTIQQPFAVQDVEGIVVGFDPDPADSSTKARFHSPATSHTADFACSLMPKAIYVQLDDCALALAASALSGTFPARPNVPSLHQRCTARCHGHQTHDIHVQTLLLARGESQVRHGRADADTADAGDGPLALLDAGHHG